MSHVGSKTRLPGQIVGNFWLHSRGYICNLILMKLGQNVCFWQYLGQVRKHVMSGQKLGHQFKYEEILVYTLDVTFATWFWWYFVRMFVLTISRPSLDMGHFGSNMSPVVHKAMKKGNLKVFCLRWAFQGPLGTLVSSFWFQSNKISFYAPRKIWGMHIVAALSVRQPASGLVSQSVRRMSHSCPAVNFIV